MNHKLGRCIGLFILIGSMASGQPRFSESDQMFYNSTLQSCQIFRDNFHFGSLIKSTTSPQAIEVLVGTFGDINSMSQRFFSGDPKAFESLRKNKGLGSHIHSLLQSPAFFQALQDCSSDFKIRQSYVYSLLITDGIMKFVMGAGTVIGYLKFFKWAYAYIHLPWVKTLFLGQTATLLSASSSETMKTSQDLMNDQYESLNAQIEALINAETNRKKP